MPQGTVPTAVLSRASAPCTRLLAPPKSGLLLWLGLLYLASCEAGDGGAFC